MKQYKAKKVYEFIQKKSLKNTVKDEVGIHTKQYYEKLINDWFNKWVSDDIKYKIYPDKKETHIYNPLDLSNSKCEIIPEGFYIQYRYSGYGLANWSLNIKNSNIKKIGKNLILVGGLDARHSKLEEWPENLEIRTYGFYEDKIIKLGYTPLNKIPNNIYLKCSLDLSYSNITELPKKFGLAGNLYLNNSKIKELPDDFEIFTGYIYVNDEDLEYFKTKYKHKFYKFKTLNSR